MRRLTARRLVGKDSMFLSGYGSRDLIVAVGGKPFWVRSRHAWMTSVRRGSDAIALAEAEGYVVDYAEIGGAE
jgi:hypothetical protein